MSSVESQRLIRSQAQLVVVDIQDKMLPQVLEHETVLIQSIRMIRAAREFELPITVSEQYVRGLGATRPEILAAVGTPGQAQFEKLSFSVMGHEPLRQHIIGLNRSQVLLVGIETHVCVLQTALDLLEWGQRPVVLADAVSSRRATDRAVALDRLRAVGAMVTTVESAIFELLEKAGTDLFKRILPIVR